MFATSFLRLLLQLGSFLLGPVFNCVQIIIFKNKLLKNILVLVKDSLEFFIVNCSINALNT